MSKFKKLHKKKDIITFLVYTVFTTKKQHRKDDVLWIIVYTIQRFFTIP